ncbi:MAG: hypothetical protein HRU15_20255 [Planctomycetes bacterium]|nr:hypothetical protein [Planctomycetota bacterium]
MTIVALEGTGASVSFATSTVVADLISLNLPEIAREPLETTNLGTVGGKTFKPGKIRDYGEVSMVFDYNPGDGELIIADAEVVTITYPLLSGETTAATRVFTGFVTAEGGEEFAVDTLMRLNRTFKVDGSIVYTPAVLAAP